MLKKNVEIRPAEGKLGILLPGLGSVATTFLAGVFRIRKGLSKPLGSLTQMGTVRLGKRVEKRTPLIRELVPLAGLDDLVFGGWDIFDEDAYATALHAGVLTPSDLEPVREELEAIRPWPAVFEREWVRRLDGPNVKREPTKRGLAEAIRDDIRRFREERGLTRVVAIWCGSTEVYCEPGAVHATLAAFEAGLEASDPGISPSQIYAYACLKEQVPYANGAPNVALEIGALRELARELSVPVAGKDFKTGQTLMKTVLAPAFKARLLGIDGWFSTNLLGNRDGEVLEDPGSFKGKEVTKLGVLDTILQPELYPDLYGDMHHAVRINYYRPRGDNKEGWDNIDLRGWLDYPMQLKVNFLCRDSILAAPIVLDLALFLDLAARAGLRGPQEWLSFYWKSPMTQPGVYPEHDLFIQLKKLKNTLRYLRGEELITHLGHEYYD
jgi:myo-inositol-1-phosphate synthase